jgi:hypothetical protein
LTSHPSVTPDDLRSDPELAILDTLGHTIELAVYALVAIYPELTDSERPDWRRENFPARNEAAHLIACGQKLETAIGRYRTAILDAREEQVNQDLPF